MKFLRSAKGFQFKGKTDEDLIAHYKQTGDEAVVEILFDRYGHLLFAVCMNYLKSEAESKDAVLEIFGKLMNDLKRYEIRNFGNWIHRVAKNYCFHELKKRKIQTATGAEIADIDKPSDEDAEVQIETYLLQYLDEAMQSLNEGQRVCVELFYVKEKSYEEIEKLTGYSYNQVKSYIQNGKRNLKIYLSSKQHGK